ncbi:MFS transporter [Methylobacterium iners]|uniref:Riboflavin transporter RibZ n=1 Tax=Methylobacterium iners TaxID=418707 RepID=A0ABQ4S074_9HYPH|nr:MFS transporter [Methylobacterium iners]GJD95339.1 Riboflavin transporter RibZ [Methylobacterium iners]
MTDAARAPEPGQIKDGLPARERGLAMLAIALALMMAVLDGAIVNVALPAMARELGVSPRAAVFVVSGFQIAVTVCLLPFAALGDILGYRRVYLAGLALFTAASLACALSPTLDWLIVSRILQGIGGAGIMSVNIALVRFIYPNNLIGRGVSNTALVVALSSAAGPTAAAAILTVAGWPWLFLVNVPIGIVAFAAAIRTLPATPRSGARFDGLSAILNALTFGLLIIGIDGLGHPEGRPTAIAEIAAALVLGAVFVRHQLTLAAPLLPVDLLRIPVFALSMATSIVSFCAQMMAYVALPFYLHEAMRLSEAQTGLLMTAWPIAIAVVAPISGRLADRYAPGLLGGIGLSLMAMGLAAMAALPPTPVAIIGPLTLCGIGFGLFQPPNNKAILTSAPRSRSGGAGGMQATARLVGQSLGSAVVAVIFGFGERSGDAAGPSGAVPLVLWCAAGLSTAGAIASALRLRRRSDA